MGVMQQIPGVLEAIDVSSSDWVLTTDLTEDSAEGVILYIGGTGDIFVDGLKGGVNVKIAAHPVGYTKFTVKKVYNTGTTATNIVAVIG